MKRSGIYKANYINIIEEILFIIVLTQYFGALGQYSIVLDRNYIKIWSGLYIICKFLILSIIFLQRVKLKISINCLSTCFFLVYMCLISLYSTITPIKTAGYIFKLIVTILIGWHYANKYDMERILSLTSIAQIIFLILTFIFIIKFPSYAFFYDSQGKHVLLGIYTTKNSCAFQLGFGALIHYICFKFCIINKKYSYIKKLYPFLVILQILMILKCEALGSLVALILCLLITEVIVKFKKRIPLGTLYIIINSLFFVIVLAFLPLFSNILESFGRDATLTGRTNIWKSIAQYMEQGNLLFGYGYESFWGNENLTKELFLLYDNNDVLYNYIGAHNSIIEFILYFGVIGLLIILCFITGKLNLSKYIPYKENMFCTMITLYITLRGLVERTFSDSSYDTLYFIIVISIIHKYKCYKYKEKEKYNS